MVGRALVAMAQGGLHDQVGRGFFRYCVDNTWRVPHYEKMLSENALMALCCLSLMGVMEGDWEGWTRSALDYMLETLQSASGGFYSSQDADDAQGEGAFYLWTQDQVTAVLGEADGLAFCALYGIGARNADATQAEGQPHCDLSGHCTPGPQAGGILPYRALRFTQEQEAFAAYCLPRLNKTRSQRPKPTVVTLCPLMGNALAITALANAARSLSDGGYLLAAQRAANFIKVQMIQDGRLYSSWSQGLGGGTATLDGYGAWVQALLTLSVADPEGHWLEEAVIGMDSLLAHFLETDGRLRLTGKDQRDLPIVLYALQDDALPSGASLCLESLIALWQTTGLVRYRDACQRILDATLADAALLPMAHAGLIGAYDRWQGLTKPKTH